MTFVLLAPGGLSAVEMLYVRFSGLVCRIQSGVTHRPSKGCGECSDVCFAHGPAALLMLASHY